MKKKNIVIVCIVVIVCALTAVLAFLSLGRAGGEIGFEAVVNRVDDGIAYATVTDDDAGFLAKKLPDSIMFEIADLGTAIKANDTIYGNYLKGTINGQTVRVVSVVVTGANPTARKSIYEHGIDLISLMEEMAESESYFGQYSRDTELQEIIFEVGSGDYTEPKAVYQIKISDDMISGMAEVASIDGLSDTLKEYVTSRAQTAVATRINALGGANMLAAASICTAGKTFVSNELTENAIYLYAYENAVPAIVAFTTGEDGAVSASGSFIFYEDFKTDTAEDIEQFFAEVAAEVEEVEK